MPMPQVQVRSGHASGRAHQSEDRTCRHRVARFHVDAAQVAVHRHDAVTVVDEYRVAVEEEVAGLDHASGRGAQDRRAGGGGDVHAAVRIARPGR